MSDDTNQNGDTKQEYSHELSKLLDPNYPLLKKFREICPGTYKHSQTVAGMIEGVAVSINLDTTSLKVAATYHDYGKILNPKYFTENQLQEEDLHKDLDPSISFQIISRHVSDTTLLLLNDENFPRDLIRIISQHHGTSVMKYFFNKSNSTNPDLYRYKFEKPSSPEAGILMICDVIEARSRSEIQSGNGQLDPSDLIEDVINSLLDDGQLDNIYIRLGELKLIKEALIRELEGTFQKRVDYNKASE